MDKDVDYVFETNDFWMSGANDVFENAGIMYMCAYVDFDPNFWPDMQYAFTGTNGSANDLKALLEQCKALYPDVHKLIYVSNDDGLGQLKHDYIASLCSDYGLELSLMRQSFMPRNRISSSIATQMPVMM